MRFNQIFFDSSVEQPQYHYLSNTNLNTQEGRYLSGSLLGNNLESSLQQRRTERPDIPIGLYQNRDIVKTQEKSHEQPTTATQFLQGKSHSSNQSDIPHGACHRRNAFYLYPPCPPGPQIRCVRGPWSRYTFERGS